MFDISLKCKYCTKMNASSWKKAADLIAQGTQATQKIQAAATADSSQLESLPLSSLAANVQGSFACFSGGAYCIAWCWGIL